MKSTTSFSTVQAPAEASAHGNLASVVESPIVGKNNARRMTTTSKSSDGKTVSVLVEEYSGDKLMSRQFEQHLPTRSTTRELYEPDGSLISSETERRELNGQQTKIVIRGSGKSSTTRILSGEVEARGTERSVLIETPKASYSYHPFDGRWSSFYKEISMKLELKANFLKSPDSTLNGPDGIKLVFRNGRLVDMILSEVISSRADAGESKVPSIIE